jgi:hypothetical protein
VAIIEKQTPEGKVSVRVCKSPNHGGEYHIRYGFRYSKPFKHPNAPHAQVLKYLDSLIPV